MVKCEILSPVMNLRTSSRCNGRIQWIGLRKRDPSHFIRLLSFCWWPSRPHSRRAPRRWYGSSWLRPKLKETTKIEEETSTNPSRPVRNAWTASVNSDMCSHGRVVAVQKETPADLFPSSNRLQEKCNIDCPNVRLVCVPMSQLRVQVQIKKVQSAVGLHSS